MININKNQDFKNLLFRYISYWKWFVASVLFFLMLSFLYIRYTTPLYKTTATILVKDKYKGSLENELTAFADNRSFKESNVSVSNEIFIIKSRSLVEKVVDNLNLNYIYRTEGRVKGFDIYDTKPISLTIIDAPKGFNYQYTNFKITILNATEFELFIGDDDTKIGTFSFNKAIEYEDFVLSISKTPNFKNFNFQTDIFITVIPLNDVVTQYSKSVNVQTLSTETSVVELTYIDPISQRAEDFINKLVEFYNQSALKEKEFISNKTIEFINKRIDSISNNLRGVENEFQSFKETNQTVDIQAETSLYINYERKTKKN